jgi:hypothetical protein
METKIIEATDSAQSNRSQFMVCRFDQEWSWRSNIVSAETPRDSVGWSRGVLLVLDLQTGEGAVFKPGGYAKDDLDRHQIRVCPMFEPFLGWLYEQPLEDLQALPATVNLGDAPVASQGYRRNGMTFEEMQEAVRLEDGRRFMFRLNQSRAQNARRPAERAEIEETDLGR